MQYYTNTNVCAKCYLSHRNLRGRWAGKLLQRWHPSLVILASFCLWNT